MDIQMNTFRWKTDVYDRSQEDVCLGDLDLEIIMLLVCVKTMTQAGIFQGIMHEEGKIGLKQNVERPMEELSGKNQQNSQRCYQRPERGARRQPHFFPS